MRDPYRVRTMRAVDTGRCARGSEGRDLEVSATLHLQTALPGPQREHRGEQVLHR